MRLRPRRMRLRRADGEIYLDRWGLQLVDADETALCGAFLHRMQAPDPGIDLHDHPWTFWSFVIKGGYLEFRQESRRTGRFSMIPETSMRRRWSWRKMRLDECHRIFSLWRNRPVWTLVLHGPDRRTWGFFLDGSGRWMQWQEYDETVRAERRDMHYEVNTR